MCDISGAGSVGLVLGMGFLLSCTVALSIESDNLGSLQYDTHF